MNVCRSLKLIICNSSSHWLSQLPLYLHIHVSHWSFKSFVALSIKTENLNKASRELGDLIPSFSSSHLPPNSEAIVLNFGYALEPPGALKKKYRRPISSWNDYIQISGDGAQVPVFFKLSKYSQAWEPFLQSLWPFFNLL